MDIAPELLNVVNDDPDLLKQTITNDESWVYGFGMKTAAQSSK